MQIFNFTIQGNTENPAGNPLGYTRMLRYSKRDDAVKYRAWCAHVRDQFEQQIDTGNRSFYDGMGDEKPLTTTRGSPARMDIEIEFANDARADCDNVYKGIADALFKNDKYLMDGSFKGTFAEDKIGKVKIKIIIY
jgi:hypothetical protein